MGTPCPANSFSFGDSGCVCDPGYYVPVGQSSCSSLSSPGNGISESGGNGLRNASVSYLIREYVTVNRIITAQLWFIVVTSVVVGLWLAMCFLLRKAPLRDGRSAWFRWRYWISRLDYAYANHHWLEDQKTQVKRQTELGGSFTVAGWIFFIGLTSALIFEFAADRKAVAENLTIGNWQDMASISNDIDINVTLVSGMNCGQLRGLETVVAGSPGSIGERTSPLSSFAQATCGNTSMGPLVQIRCQNCNFIRDVYYISWYFVDASGSRASAVGFAFSVSSRDPSSGLSSSLDGIVDPGSNVSGGVPGTLRGKLENVLQFAFVPFAYKNKGEVKLMEASFHQYVPGTILENRTSIWSSYQNPAEGFLNVTLKLDVLSDYMIEKSNAASIGPATFLARLGGVYAISMCLFYILMRECEYRVKRLRYDDKLLNRYYARQLARHRWDKIRLYVKYSTRRDARKQKQAKAENSDNFGKRIIKTLSKIGSSLKQKTPMGPADISGPESVDIKVDGGVESLQPTTHSQPAVVERPKEVEESDGLNGLVVVPQDARTSELRGEVDQHVNNTPIPGRKTSSTSRQSDAVVVQYRIPPWALIKEPFPPVPDIKFIERGHSPPGHDLAGQNDVETASLREYIKELHEWNTRLRADLLNTQHVLDQVIKTFQPHKDY